MPQNQESNLESNLRVSQILAVALGFLTPVVYIAVYAIAVLQRNPSGFWVGFRAVPWGDPVLLVLLLTALGMLGAASMAPDFLAVRTPQGSSSLFGRLRVRLVIACAFLESIAVLGLVLGFVLGPEMASLSLVMLLVPVVGVILLFPRKAEYQAELDRAQREGQLPR